MIETDGEKRWGNMILLRWLHCLKVSQKVITSFSVQELPTKNCIKHQNESVSLWITSLFLNIVTISFNRNALPTNECMNHFIVKFSWLFIEPHHHWNFSLPRHGHNVCLLNLLSWRWRDDSLKALNLVSMEDVIKFSLQMGWLSPLYTRVSQKVMPVSLVLDYRHRTMYHTWKYSWSRLDHIPTSQQNHRFFSIALHPEGVK